MGWCSATEIMDAALNGATKMVAEAWQIASGNEDAKTPVFANELQARPELLAQLDDVLRPFVATIAAKLRDGDWDCIEESDYFDRFRQEMLGYDHHRMAEWYREHLTEEYELTHDQAVEYSTRMVHHLEEARSGR